MKNYLNGAAVAAALAFAPVLAAPAAAVTTVDFDVTGINSNEPLGDAQNAVFFVDIGAFSEVIGLAWDVNITALGLSWLSEARVALTDSAFTTGVLFTPGVGVNTSGTQTFVGASDYVDLGLNFLVGADGLLRLEFYESFNDVVGETDAIWNFGTLTVSYVPVDVPGVIPEPATWGMLIAGFGLVGFAARRRRQVTISA